jgi:hypothetical protein
MTDLNKIIAPVWNFGFLPFLLTVEQVCSIAPNFYVVNWLTPVRHDHSSGRYSIRWETGVAINSCSIAVKSLFLTSTANCLMT